MVGGRREVENGPGGFGFFLQGGKHFLLQGGEGTVKLQKEPQKCALRHIFYEFYLQYGENFLVTKGGRVNKIFS